jgi:hypothetical protein
MSLPRCSVDGCEQTVSKAGHTLCYEHWKQNRAGASQAAPKTTGDAMFSSTKLGKHFGLSSQRMNLVLAELGWIEKYVKGWTPTERGNKLGGEVREMRTKGVPYVVWPATITEHSVLKAAVADMTGEGADDTGKAASVNSASDDQSMTAFRQKFPATYRATDGHMVRSRGEMLIDNWLYMQGIVHAYERRLPIEQDVLCDFYLPSGKVYIEYWGMESDDRYAQRMAQKQQIYRESGLNLVELTDNDIQNLDDVLPRELIRYGLDCT